MARNNCLSVLDEDRFITLLVKHTKEKGIYRTIKEEPVGARRLRIESLAVPFISEYKKQEFTEAQEYFDTIKNEFYLRLQKSTQIDFGYDDK
jgi:hypothetical protein